MKPEDEAVAAVVVNTVKSRLTALREECAALRAALQPLANIALTMDGKMKTGLDDDDHILWSYNRGRKGRNDLTLGHARIARDLLNKPKKELSGAV